MRLRSALCLAALLPVCAPAQIYKWRDADGTVVYSQTPPPDREAAQVRPPPQPPEARRKAAREALDRLRGSLLRDERKAQDGAKEATGDTSPARRCRRLEERIRQLENRPQVLVRDGDGYRRLTEEERQQRLARMRATRDRHCR